jgi:hypothetical protein
MNAITEPFRALVRKKLWPVALLLVAALVAVPLTMAQEPEASVTSAPPATKKEEGMPATFVSVDEDGDVTERRRVLGERKDPFAPAELDKKTKAALKKAKAEEKAKQEDAKSDPGAESGAKGGGGGGAGGGAPTAEPPVSDAPPPAKTYPLYSVKVRFGAVDAEKQAAKTVERLAVLPNADAPVLVYRGVEEGGKVAVFELTGSVTAEGDGTCEPSPQDCQILRLREGEIEFITVNDTGDETDAQYQLEVVKIHTSKTKSKSELTKTSAAGRKVLSKLGRKSRYSFDGETGTLRKGKSLSLRSRRASL